jgi:hypothetical protein
VSFHLRIELLETVSRRSEIRFAVLWRQLHEKSVSAFAITVFE